MSSVSKPSIPEDSMTICFICAKRFRDEKCFHQHLQDSHNWARINEELNATFEFSRPLKCPYCSETKFEGLENNLYHVLNNCPATKNRPLYIIRHEYIVGILLGAAFQVYGDQAGWQINSVVKDGDRYLLPHLIKNKAGSRSPDILVYNRSIRVMMIVELSVPWELNIPRARLDAQAKMDYWAKLYEKFNYNVSCFNVEIGSRGFVSNSLYAFLRALKIDKQDSQLYATECRSGVVEYSQLLLSGRPSGFRYHRHYFK